MRLLDTVLFWEKGVGMENKWFKMGISCILFGISCILQTKVYNVSSITADMGIWMPWLGILLVGVGFYKDL